MRKKHPRKESKEEVYTVQQDQELLSFLLEKLSNKSRNSVKSILRRGQVMIDQEVSTSFNQVLRSGQTVCIAGNQGFKRNTNLKGISILFEDEDLVVIEKAAGLLSIASKQGGEPTAHRQLSEAIKQKDPSGRIFVVHRLDRDTSGVMMFAKKEKVKHKLQESWKDLVEERIYTALVEGKLPEEGTITSWLKESKSLHMHSSQNPDGGGQYAVTHYKRIHYTAQASLAEVKLETGRKNQIRVHMQDIGHPIAGDKKYGSKTNPIGRLGLHARVLAFEHPVTGKVMRFEAPVPPAFFKK
ncbi:RluA family pseudouridine synthase [Halobacillus rhizosphaerae]|uniref:RluA family pseudouridine synthase n=1 Tax=Halobacillus rhizosphaerae TaxID=3064889 RepID=UPI00398B8750